MIVTAEGILDLSECPAAIEHAGEAKHWATVNVLAQPMSQADKERQLKEGHDLWGRFTFKSTIILLSTSTEEKPKDIPPGLFYCVPTGLLLPLADVPSRDDKEIDAASASALQWAGALMAQRRNAFGITPCSLRAYHTFLDRKTVSKEFADQWDKWERDGSKGAEPQPRDSEDAAVFEAFKKERSWRDECFKLLPRKSAHPHARASIGFASMRCSLLFALL